MENVIAGLLKDFEDGHMTRRQLIQSLALAATAASAASGATAAPAAEGKGFKTASINHISYQVADYRRTRDFYIDLMGMVPVRTEEDKGVQCRLHFGNQDSVLLARNRRPARGEPADTPGKPVVDHIAYTIQDWDTEKVRAELQRRGLKPRFDSGALPEWASFHVSDPDGYDLQIGGFVKKGDSMYGKKRGTE